MQLRTLIAVIATASLAHAQTNLCAGQPDGVLVCPVINGNSFAICAAGAMPNNGITQSCAATVGGGSLICCASQNACVYHGQCTDTLGYPPLANPPPYTPPVVVASPVAPVAPVVPVASAYNPPVVVLPQPVASPAAPYNPPPVVVPAPNPTTPAPPPVVPPYNPAPPTTPVSPPVVAPYHPSPAAPVVPVVPVASPVAPYVPPVPVASPAAPVVGGGGYQPSVNTPPTSCHGQTDGTFMCSSSSQFTYCSAGVLQLSQVQSCQPGLVCCPTTKACTYPGTCPNAPAGNWAPATNNPDNCKGAKDYSFVCPNPTQFTYCLANAPVASQLQTCQPGLVCCATSQSCVYPGQCGTNPIYPYNPHATTTSTRNGHGNGVNPYTKHHHHHAYTPKVRHHHKHNPYKSHSRKPHASATGSVSGSVRASQSLAVSSGSAAAASVSSAAAASTSSH
ncbi:hypothetical protein HDU98_010573 [Podochytrium sp. JEL0797]|nr:hypothetical protein HDU98_010573 [Podochytrium sp. JEL0797]